MVVFSQLMVTIMCALHYMVVFCSCCTVALFGHSIAVLLARYMELLFGFICTDYVADICDVQTALSVHCMAVSYGQFHMIPPYGYTTVKYNIICAHIFFSSNLFKTFSNLLQKMFS